MAKRGLTGTGTVVKVGNNAMNYVKSFTGLGGSAADLDGTSLSDTMKIHVSGLPDAGIPTISYFFDNSDSDSDFRVLKSIEDTGDAVSIEIKLPDGTTFSSTALIKTYIDGDVDENLIMAKAELTLQSSWAVTNPASK